MPDTMGTAASRDDVHALLQEGIACADRDYARSLYCVEEALRLALDIDDAELIADARLNCARVQRVVARYEQAIRNLDEAVGVFEALGDKHRRASAYRIYAAAYDEIGLSDDATEYCQRSYALFSELGDVIMKASCCRDMGHILRRRRLFDESLTAIDNGVAMLTATDATTPAAISRRLHLEMARLETLLDAERYPDILKIVGPALDYAIRAGNQNSRAFTLAAGALAFAELGDISKSDEMAAECIDCLETANGPYERIRAMADLGSAFRLTGNGAKARKFLFDALDLSLKQQLPYLQAKCHARIADFCEQTGELESALHHLRLQRAEELRVSEHRSGVQLNRLRREVESERALLVQSEQRQDELERIVALRTQELGAALKEANAANAAKSAFLAQMSHELRTPLNAILGFSEVMRAGVFGRVQIPKYNEYLDHIMSSGEHLLNLINDVLDLSRLAAGKVDFNVTAFDARGTIMDAVTMLSGKASSQGVTINCTGTLGANLLADKQAFRQVMLNLLDNAIKFSPSGSEVGVSLRRNGRQQAVIEVRDSGRGIPDDRQEQIFEPFGRLDHSYRSDVDGFGLGLSLTKRLVEAQNGTIQLTSRVGVGTTVKLTLPLAGTADGA